MIIQTQRLTNGTEREIRLRPVNDKEKSNDGHGSVRKKMISQ